MNIKKRTLRYLLLLLFAVGFIVTHYPRLHNDIFSTDADYWHNRSKNFMMSLEEKDYLETYQKYHPGVTLMWTTGLTAKAVSAYNNLSLDFIFDNLLDFHYLAKLTLVSWQFILSFVAIFLLAKIFKFEKAVLMVLLFSVEPFFVGNARLLHLDAQMTLYLLIGLTLSYLAIKKENLLYPIFAGLFFALGALTKSIALGALLFAVFGSPILMVFNKNFIKAIKFFVLILISFGLTYFGLFPALWTDAEQVLSNMFERSFRVGKVKGHEQIFFGNRNHNPGFWFYPVLLFLKLSWITITGFIIYYIGRIHKIITRGFNKHIIKYIQEMSFTDYISIFYLGFFIVLTYFDKKVDRYPIPLYPFFAIVAVQGFYFLSKKIRWPLIIITTIPLIYSLITVFPHYMVYTNPIIGNAKDGNEIVGQKLFGIGIYDLRQHIIDKYGTTHEIAINDPGPMKSIYEWDTFNVFVEHPNSYDFAILGPNKEIPPSIEGSGVEFRHHSSVYINGLEFWRVYLKEHRLENQYNN